jgi:WD40 repeat protein
VRGQGEDRGWDLWIYDADMQPLALLTDYIDETFGWVKEGEYFFIGRTIFDVHTLKEVYTIASMSGILGWSGEREELLALLPDYKRGFFDAHTGQFTRSLSIGPYVEGIIWSPDGNSIVLADGHTTRIVSADNGHTIAVLDKDYASGLTWSPDSHYVAGFTLTEVEPGTPNTLPYAAGAVIASAVVWDTDTGKAVQTYSGLQVVPVFLRWSPDNTQLIGGSSLGLVYVWDLVSEQQLKSFTLPHALYDLVVSPLGGRLFAVAYPAYGELGEHFAEQRTIFPQGDYWSQDFMSGLGTVIVIEQKTVYRSPPI